jgi:hypothetical protein
MMSDPPWAIPASMNQIGAHPPNELLHRIDVLRDLDNGATKPFEIVSVAVPYRFAQPHVGQA